jgi:hypothetical protein
VIAQTLLTVLTQKSRPEEIAMQSKFDLGRLEIPRTNAPAVSTYEHGEDKRRIHAAGNHFIRRP